MLAIRYLKSNVHLHLEPGALAAETPMEGTASGGYDAAEANRSDNKFQDFGHNLWHNRLIWAKTCTTSALWVRD